MKAELEYENLFECVYPPLFSQLEYRKHPIHPIQCSNYGSLSVIHDPTEAVKNYTTKVKSILIYECWHQTILPKYAPIRLKNLNPYDYRPDNLELIVKYDQERVAKEKMFFSNTIEEMLKREQELKDKYDMEKYFVFLGLTTKYINEWKRRNGTFKGNILKSLQYNHCSE